MRALVWHGTKDIRLEKKEIPKVQDHEVKVKVAWAGICGTDLHEYMAGPIFIPQGKHPITGHEGPVTLGHEFSGIIEEVGAKVNNYKKGDKVVVNPLIIQSHLPPPFDMYAGCTFYGLGANGAFADFVVVHEKNIVKVNKDFSLQLGALVEPAAVVVQAVKEAGMKMGDSVAVFGAGPIGLLQIQAAKAAGAIDIFAFDVSEDRLVKAKEMGATYAGNSSKEDPVALVKSLYPLGVDIAFEVAGVQQTLDYCIRLTKARGKVCIVSIFEKPVTFHPMSLTLTGVQIVTTLGYEFETFNSTVKLIENGQIKPLGIITSRIALDDIIEKGFKKLINDKSQSKILVQLSGAE